MQSNQLRRSSFALAAACTGLWLLTGSPVTAQEDAEAPAQPAEPAAEPGDDELFGEENDGLRSDGPLQIDPDTPTLTPGEVSEIEPGAARTIHFQISAEAPGLLTLFMDSSTTPEMILRGPDNRLINHEAMRQIENNPRQLILENIQLQGNLGVPQVRSYRLTQPGEYLISIILSEATQAPSNLSAGLITLPEGWFEQEAGRGNQPAPPINPARDAVEIELDTWTPGAWPRNQYNAWVKFKAEQPGVYVYTVRPDERQDSTLTLFADNALGNAIMSVDSDPLGNYDKESIVFAADAGKTYYIMIRDLGESGGTFRGMLIRLPEELPNADSPDASNPDANE
ncbi:MAG: hypothetical protein AAGC44_12420 [Planctomycetota bacterium]